MFWFALAPSAAGKKINEEGILSSASCEILFTVVVVVFVSE